jgi:hypothetical protein
VSDIAVVFFEVNNIDEMKLAKNYLVALLFPFVSEFAIVFFAVIHIDEEKFAYYYLFFMSTSCMS